MRSNGPGTIVSTSTGPVLVPGKKLSADSSLIAANLILLLQKPISMPRTTAGPLSQKTGTNSCFTKPALSDWLQKEAHPQVPALLSIHTTSMPAQEDQQTTPSNILPV
ncbi:hypothetical protein PtA15_14A215 [Puccinia triticina]|uniref:Uncharacterized protein n=1 Tax=Puccinia triticina TaxID=208348 RepID=A0ABY7D8V2_9BASI|nr:uncharacterized protein PtA15_14A215 [Puccinia triticina]WAQ91332.1 hypothetical protein PtA15_14A215 [Puccinia triticina]